MIGRVYRGAQVGGLLRYLYGPGRHNEHENPHLVAAWDLESASELATLEPLVLSGSGARASRDFGPMTRSMELATAFRAPSTSQKVIDRQVWHCPLRVAPGDRALTDAEWAQVARDVMHRTGIARHGDDGGCRWVAVRHDEHSVHLVAVLARQDGRAVRLSNDYRRVREACLAAEQKYGLGATAPADRTAATHVTRAEVEKTARTAGKGAVPARVWLREQVQLAATWAQNPTEFLDGLRAAGVVVRERRDEGGGLTGYAVARISPDSQRGTGKNEPVFYGGGKLAPDLTLPKLSARWPASGGRPAADSEPGAAVVLQETAQALPQAARLVRAQAVLPQPGRVAVVDDLAAAQAELLRAVAFRLEGEAGGPVTRGARAYARAGRAAGGRPAPPTVAGAFLRQAAQQLLRTSRAGSSQADWSRVLVQALDLAAAVAELRRAQRHVFQAAAAERAAHHLGQALRPASRGQELPAAVLANRQGSGVVAVAARRPSPVQQPTQGHGRR